MAYSAAFKFKVVLASLTTTGSDKDVADEFDVHPVTLSRWKHHVLDQGEWLFEDPDMREDGASEQEQEDEEAELYQCLIEYFSEHHVGIDEKIEVVRALKPRFGLNQVCRAIGLAKSTWYYRTNRDVQSSA